MKDSVSNSLLRSVILIKIVSDAAERCLVILMKRGSNNSTALDSFAKSSYEMRSYGGKIARYFLMFNICNVCCLGLAFVCISCQVCRRYRSLFLISG